MPDIAPHMKIINCHFLRLPAELRNTIYRLVLVREDDHRIQLKNIEAPALLDTCHQIQSEGSSIFFSENKFVLTIAVSYMIFASDGAKSKTQGILIPLWIKGVQSSAPLQIQNIQVEIDYAFRWVVLAIAQAEGGLKVDQSWLHDGRQRYRLEATAEEVQALLDRTHEVKAKTESGTPGLNFQDVVQVAKIMMPSWAGTVEPE